MSNKPADPSATPFAFRIVFEDDQTGVFYAADEDHFNQIQTNLADPERARAFIRLHKGGAEHLLNPGSISVVTPFTNSGQVTA